MVRQAARSDHAGEDFPCRGRVRLLLLVEIHCSRFRLNLTTSPGCSHSSPPRITVRVIVAWHAARELQCFLIGIERNRVTAFPRHHPPHGPYGLARASRSFRKV